jgi:peptide methionine sulfoxide reductase MsrA
MLADPIVIASYARTPMGGFQGVFAPVKATELGAAAVRAAIAREQPSLPRPIATKVEPMRAFYKAEAFHQQYSERTGDHSCPIARKLESL